MAGSGGRTTKKHNDTASTKSATSSIKSLTSKASTKLKDFGKSVITSLSPKKKLKKRTIPESDSSDSVVEVDATPTSAAKKGSSQSKKRRVEDNSAEDGDEAGKEKDKQEEDEKTQLRTCFLVKKGFNSLLV